MTKLVYTQNTLMRELGLSKPIILAPMGGVSGGALAAAVSGAGGLGLIGAGYGDTRWVGQQLDLLEANRVTGSWGIGFITWCLTGVLLKESLAREPDVVMLSFGNPEPWIDQCHAAGASVFVQVQSVRAAQQAVRAGADVIVAQGSEAGGHGGGRASFSLIPAVVDAVAPVPVVAAGGIADGRGLAAAFTLGAQGVLIGTRFVASHEALSHDEVKQALLRASGDDTLRTRVFDIVRGLDWPAPYTGRALANSFTRRWHGFEDELVVSAESYREEFYAAVDSGQVETAMVWAGQGVDMISTVASAAEIIETMCLQAQQCWRQNNSA